jgi:hypothetical protein
MISATLLSILGKFTVKEYKDFGEFVKSPFFNKSENVKKLYNYLKKFHPEFSDKKLDKKYVYKKVFSKGAYNDGYMRTVIHNLGKLAEDFLIYLNSTKDELNRGIRLLEELNERKLEKVFLKYYSEIEEYLEETTYHGSDYYFKRYQLQNQMEIYMDWSKFKHKDYKNYTDKTITYVNDELTSYYLTKVLNHFRFILDKANYQQFEYNYEFMDHVLSFLVARDNHYRNKPKIKLHLYEILLFKENKDEYYKILKEMLINEKITLNHSDRYSLHNVLQSYCVRQGFSDKKSLISERFELYKICLEQKLYAATEHLYFDDLMFGNIVISGISSGELEWTEKFIKDYQHELSPENKEMVVNYCQARVYFEKRNFRESLNHLNLIRSIKHIQYKMPVKDLTLMLNYELSDFSQAFYNIDSYRHFLSNNKSSLSDMRFERIGNFLKNYSKILKLKEGKSRIDIKNFEEDLLETNNILEKKWLLNKIKELRQN